MKKKRTWYTALCAFSLTLCVVLLIFGLLVVSIRSGRVLFGEQYDPVMLQHDLPIGQTVSSEFVWLPARLRILLRVPMWEVYCLEWVSCV